MAAVGGARPSWPSDEAAHVMDAHQAFNPATTDASTPCPQCRVHARTAVTALARSVHGANVVQQCRVLDYPSAVRPLAPGIEASHRHPEHAAHHRDGPAAAMLLDGPEPHRNGLAKMAIPFLRMSRSIRSRSTSRLRRAISAAWSACGTGTGLSVDTGAPRGVGPATCPACL